MKTEASLVKIISSQCSISICRPYIHTIYSTYISIFWYIIPESLYDLAMPFLICLLL